MKLPILFAVLTALFWGCYGPALALSRGALGSPFKPYAMIGVAYLLWAIVGGVGGMAYKGDAFSFTGAGVRWGFIAGSLGAWGALTLTLAMFSGGNKAPHVVMPIVFGGAVTVTAIVGLLREQGALAEVGEHQWLWVGVVLVACGAVIVAIHTPQEAPRPAPPAAASAAAVRVFHVEDLPRR